MTYIYAVLNEKGVCENITALEDEMSDDKYVLLKEYKNLVGYRPENGEWVLDESFFVREPAESKTEVSLAHANAEIEKLKGLQLVQMEAQAEVFEQNQENMLVLFGALADIFEEIGGV